MLRTQTLRTSATILLGAGALLALAGCSQPQQDASQEPRATTIEQWQHEFDRCMKGKGVNTEGGGIPVNPDGSPLEPDENGVDVDAAVQQCTDEVGVAPEGDPADTDELYTEQLLTYAKCMREAGYDVPDPNPNNGGIVVQPNGGPDADPADVERCNEEAGLNDLG